MIDTLVESSAKLVIGLPLLMSATNFIKELFPALRTSKEGVKTRKWVRLANLGIALLILGLMFFGQFYFTEMEWRSEKTWELITANLAIAFVISGGSMAWYAKIAKPLQARAARILQDRQPPTS